MKVQCCVCKKVRHKKRWVTATRGDSVKHDVSHGYCPKCAAEAFKQIRQLTAGA